MAHNIVLQAYERSLQARAHYLPYNVPLREKPEIIRKILEKVEHLEKLSAEFSADLKKLSADFKKISHNRKEKHEKQKDEKCSNNNKIVSFSKRKSSKKPMEKSTKYIPPPMRKKGKQPTSIESKKVENCWKCRDKYFAGHKCVVYSKNSIASDSKKAQKDEDEVGLEEDPNKVDSASQKTVEEYINDSRGGKLFSHELSI